MTVTIRFKLLATLLTATGGVVLCMFLIMQWSFNEGFRDYVMQQERQTYESFVTLLQNEWQTQGNWERLRNNRRAWDELLSAGFGSLTLPQSAPSRPQFPQGREGERPPPPPNARPPGPPPHDALPRADAPRLPYLLDENKHIIWGRPTNIAELTLYPISVNKKTVGFVGQIPQKELTSQLDLLFVKQQNQAFTWVSAILIVISILATLPIASHLSKPIRLLSRGTQKLISGNYETTISVQSQDELGQLSQNFNTLAKTLLQNENSRRQWVADISHELRTPLAVLKGEIEAIQDGIRQPSTTAIESLHAEACQLNRLVDDLYELSMSDIGALSYQKAKINIVDILQLTVASFNDEYRHQGIDLALRLHQSNVMVFADASRIRQLVSNLLKNTLRYTDSAGRLEIDIETKNKQVLLHFKDSAPGVSKEELGRLFERLFRVESSRNRATGGAGLGLSICSNIVAAHDGKISAQPSPLGGIWITIALPLAN